MAAPTTAPRNLAIQQGNQQILLTWTNLAGATSYSIKRSTNNVSFSVLNTSTVNQFVDTTAVLGTMYWYQVAGVTGVDVGPYTTTTAQMVAAPNAEMSLYELRLRAQQRADRVNSNFVVTTEWNFFINQACYELYDILIDMYEDYYSAPEVSFTTQNNQYLYSLPNGTDLFTNASGSSVVAEPFYKLLGLDLGVNQQSNAYVTINKYNLIDRNRFIYPNSNSSLYGVFNLQYRVMGSKIRLIPTPSAGQSIRLLYAPRLAQLLLDSDLTTIGHSGWLQYVIVRAAKYALDKEESDTTKLDDELLFLKTRIEAAAANRDAGQPDRISDTRSSNGWDTFGPYKNGW